MIEPIGQELREYLDRILEGDFRGVYKPFGRIKVKYHQSRASKERIEELKTLIHDEDYLDRAIQKIGSDFAKGMCMLNDTEQRKI